MNRRLVYAVCAALLALLLACDEPNGYRAGCANATCQPEPGPPPAWPKR